MATPADLRFRQSLDVPGIARLIAQRPVQEEQIRASQQQRRQQKFSSLLETVRLGAGLAEQASLSAQRRQAMTRKAEFESIVEQLAGRTEFAAPEGQQFPGALAPPQIEQQRTQADLIRLQDPTALKALTEQQFPGTSRRGPRSIEAFFVEKANRGEITIDEAVNQIQLAEPRVKRITDNEGNQFLLNLVTRQKTALTGTKAPSPTGKTTRGQFTPNERKAITSAKTTFNKNPAVIENKKAFNIIGSLRELVKRRPKGAIGITLTQQAKFAGEMGRLTDQDISRNAPTPDIAQSIVALRDKWITGQISEVASERLANILNIVEAKRAEELEIILAETLDALQLDVTDANRSALRTRIGAGILSKIDKLQSKTQEKSQIDALFADQE